MIHPTSRILCFAAAAAALAGGTAGAVPAVPNATGFGATSVGGRGGDV